MGIGINQVFAIDSKVSDQTGVKKERSIDDKIVELICNYATNNSDHESKKDLKMYYFNTNNSEFHTKDAKKTVFLMSIFLDKMQELLLENQKKYKEEIKDLKELELGFLRFFVYKNDKKEFVFSKDKDEIYSKEDIQRDLNDAVKKIKDYLVKYFLKEIQASFNSNFNYFFYIKNAEEHAKYKSLNSAVKKQNLNQKDIDSDKEVIDFLDFDFSKKRQKIADYDSTEKEKNRGSASQEPHNQPVNVEGDPSGRTNIETPLKSFKKESQEKSSIDSEKKEINQKKDEDFQIELGKRTLEHTKDYMKKQRENNSGKKPSITD